MKKILCYFLILSIGTGVLSGCADKTQDGVTPTLITEEVIDEVKIEEVTIDEHIVSEDYIFENMTYEDGLYELSIDESLLCEAYTFTITVGDASEEEIRQQLPENIDDYDVNWPKVVAEFAVGTTIIIATGIVKYKLGPSTYWVIASPEKVAKDAFTTGAMFAAINVASNKISDSDASSDGIWKWTVEGFAHGFMIGAISSVLKVSVQNFVRVAELRFPSGAIARITADGSVIDNLGNNIGKAYWDKNGIYIKDASDIVTHVFDLKGNLLSPTEAIKVLNVIPDKFPPNTILKLGEGISEKICYTDDLGNIYRIGNDIVPDALYQVGGASYKADAMGRPIQMSVQNLSLKPDGQARRPINATIEMIGRGSQRAGDQRGHLLADMFNGRASIGNLVPMSQEVNQGTYKAVETTLQTALNSGKTVSNYTVNVLYDSNSFRPSSFEVLYQIDAESFSLTIIN